MKLKPYFIRVLMDRSDVKGMACKKEIQVLAYNEDEAVSLAWEHKAAGMSAYKVVDILTVSS